MVVAFSTFKGGASKTSLCVNTAAQWARAGRRVRVLDLDTTQKDALWFKATLEALGVEVMAAEASNLRQLIREAGDDICLLDTGPSGTPNMAAALTTADFVVVPIANSQALRNTVKEGGFREVIAEAREKNSGLREFYVMTLQDFRISDTAGIEADARAMLKADVMMATLRLLAPWGKAMNEGQDLETYDAGCEATREARAFASELWERINGR